MAAALELSHAKDANPWAAPRQFFWKAKARILHSQSDF
jgi:hypothetical protein